MGVLDHRNSVVAEFNVRRLAAFHALMFEMQSIDRHRREHKMNRFNRHQQRNVRPQVLRVDVSDISILHEEQRLQYRPSGTPLLD